MKKFIILFAIIACASALDIHEKFKQHLKKHKKNYDHLSEAEFQRRQEIFLRNSDKIEKHNNDPKHHYKLGINEFSDLDHNELLQRLTGNEPAPTPRALPPPASVNILSCAVNASVDYRKYAQPVVYQPCNCCWAYATAAVLGNIKT